MNRRWPQMAADKDKKKSATETHGRRPCGTVEAYDAKLMMLEPKTIETDDQYRAYLAEVERLVADDPVRGTPDGDRLALLVKLVEDYEKVRFRFRRPDPIETNRFRTEERG